MVFATIHSYPNNPRLLRTRVAAALNGLELSIPPFEFRKSNRTPEYLSKFPFGKVPALETPSGLYIAESSAIAHYVADSGPARDQLLGATPEERAKIQQWVAHDLQEIIPTAQAGVLPRMGFAQFDEKTDAEALANLNKLTELLEGVLQKNKWIAGTEKFSLADLQVAGTFYMPFQLWLGNEWREQHKVLWEWWQRLVECEHVKEVYGEIKLKE